MPAAQGVRLTVQVVPNAKKTEVIGELEDALKLRLHAPPVDGKANEALIRFLAERLQVAKSAIHLTHGQTARRKILEVRADLSVDAVQEMLLEGRN